MICLKLKTTEHKINPINGDHDNDKSHANSQNVTKLSIQIPFGHGLGPLDRSAAVSA